MLGRGPRTVALVVSVLAGHASAQPSATPPTAPPPPPSTPAPAPVPPTPEQPREQHTLCFFGRPHECASVFLLELGVRGGPDDRAVTTGDLGLLIHDGANAYGATVGFAAITDAEVSLMYAGRYRRYLGEDGFAADVALGYAGGPMAEVALGFGDIVAVTAGINHYQLEDGGNELVATAGLRVGAVTIGGILYVAALIASSAR